MKTQYKSTKKEYLTKYEEFVRELMDDLYHPKYVSSTYNRLKSMNDELKEPLTLSNLEHLVSDYCDLHKAVLDKSVGFDWMRE